MLYPIPTESEETALEAQRLARVHTSRIIKTVLVLIIIAGFFFAGYRLGHQNTKVSLNIIQNTPTPAPTTTQLPDATKIPTTQVTLPTEGPTTISTAVVITSQGEWMVTELPINISDLFTGETLKTSLIVKHRGCLIDSLRDCVGQVIYISSPYQTTYLDDWASESSLEIGKEYQQLLYTQNMFLWSKPKFPLVQEFPTDAGYIFKLNGQAQGYTYSITLWTKTNCLITDCALKVIKLDTNGPYTDWIDAIDLDHKTIYRLIVGDTFFDSGPDFETNIIFGWIKSPELMTGFTIIRPK